MVLFQTKLCTSPLDIFQFMFTQGIATSLAQFYVFWAQELESVGNTKKADLIYNQGLQNAAQPLDFLQKRHQ